MLFGRKAMERGLSSTRVSLMWFSSDDFGSLNILRIFGPDGPSVFMQDAVRGLEFFDPRAECTYIRNHFKIRI